MQFLNFQQFFKSESTSADYIAGFKFYFETRIGAELLNKYKCKIQVEI